MAYRIIRKMNTNGDRENRSQSESFVLPEWAFGIIRPVGTSLSRVLWRIRYHGLEHVPLTGSLIIAANHQTYIDPFWVGFPIKRSLRFLAWNQSFDWPLVGKLMGMFGAWPIQLDRGDPAAIRRALQWLRNDGAVVIFPEGGRGNPDGSMVRFKHGAVRIALESGAPILPVTIRGAHRVWPKTRRLPGFGNVEVIYHPPHHVCTKAGEDNRICARRESERIAEIIRSAL
jgi:1-acyl-sn-glycerol-3-phosphate acyltransferase